MNSPIGSRCDAEQIRQILALVAQDAAAGLEAIEMALPLYPGDPRLHFLKGSLLIGMRRHIAAYAALTRAIEIDPDYAIARFQLGFFELTSGEAEAARVTLAPLERLPEGHYLRHFAQGLDHLMHDRFEACIDSLRAGQVANAENLPLNRDMDLIIDKCLGLVGPVQQPARADEISATSLLLQSTGMRSRLH